MNKIRNISKRNVKYGIYRRTKRKHTLRKVTACLFTVFFVSLGLSFFIVNNVRANNKEQLHKYYTPIKIEVNDTLWGIASSNDTSGYDSIESYIDEVKFINHIENIDEIKAGETLIIPYFTSEVK